MGLKAFQNGWGYRFGYLFEVAVGRCAFGVWIVQKSAQHLKKIQWVLRGKLACLRAPIVSFLVHPQDGLSKTKCKEIEFPHPPRSYSKPVTPDINQKKAKAPWQVCRENRLSCKEKAKKEPPVGKFLSKQCYLENIALSLLKILVSTNVNTQA